jgi:hypothetical protein
MVGRAIVHRHMWVLSRLRNLRCVALRASSCLHSYCSAPYYDPKVWLVVTCALYLLYSASCWKQEEHGSIGRLISDLESAHQCSVIIFSSDAAHEHSIHGISAQPPLRAHVKRFLELMVSELSIYPCAIGDCFRVKEIILCDALKGGPIFAGAFAVPTHGRVYFDVGVFAERRVSPMSRRMIHHELFHIPQGTHISKWLDDDTWQDFHRDAEGYLGGEVESHRDPKGALADSSALGFVTRYARANATEDQAEIFSFLMVLPIAMHERGEHDQVIRRKCELIRGFVNELDARFDKQFWIQRAEQEKRMYLPHVLLWSTCIVLIASLTVALWRWLTGKRLCHKRIAK